MSENKQKEIIQWNCTACTFLNNETDNKCAICNTIKQEKYQNNLHLSNDYNNEYSYYNQDLEYNQYDDVEWDLFDKQLKKKKLKKKKRKKKSKQVKQRSKIINKNISHGSTKQPTQTTVNWASYQSSSKEPVKIVYNVDTVSGIKLEICDNDIQETQNKKSSSIINYKQYAKNMGLSIRWSKKTEYIFPHYRPIYGNMLSEYRINIAKKVVCLLLKQEKNKIIQTFKQFADKKYFGKRKEIILKVDMNRALQRVKVATIQEDDTETFGEADECNVWITKCNISDEDLIGTLLHEALHFIATLNHREMCEKDEHSVIKMLGDDEC